MKGIVFEDFGLPEKALRIKNVETPVPADNQVIVNVKASCLNITDYAPFMAPISGQKVPEQLRQMYMMQLNALGNVFGMDIAGVVEEVGKDVTTVKKGDEVFGFTHNWLGAWAEYACANENEVAIMPSNLSFEAAATLPVVGMVALGGVRIADVKKGQQVLVTSASGGVGTLLVQILKAFGADVTGVCSTRNINMVRHCGADDVVDYTKEDFTKRGKTYDAIFAVNGYKTLDEYLSLLNPGGSYVVIGGMEQAAEAQQFGAEKFKNSSKNIGLVIFNQLKRELSTLAQLSEQGKLTPVIDKVYPIEEVSSAIRDIIANHAKGKVALAISFR